MGFDWEEVLGTDGVDLADAYDGQASDALYQDHPKAAPAYPLSPAAHDHQE